MSYFRFYSNYHFIYDSKSETSCLYDVLKKERCVYDKIKSRIIQSLLNNAWEEITEENVREVGNDFIVTGKAAIRKEKTYTENYCNNSELTLYGLFEPIPAIDCLHIQLSDKNNQRNLKEKVLINSCYACIGWGCEDILDANIEKKITSFFKGMYIQKICFHGESLESEREKMAYIIKNLKSGNDDIIYIYVSDISISKEMLEFCNSYNIKGIITIYEHEVTGKNNYIWKMLDKINNLIRFTINYVVETKKYNDGIENLKSMGYTIEHYSEFLGGSNQLYSMSNFEERKKSMKIYFGQEYELQNCLNRRLAVDCTGNVYPCPAINEKLGNINIEERKDIFSYDSIHKWWFRTKNDIELCAECAYKYGCHDCKVIEQICMKDSEIAKKVCENMYYETSI